MEKTIQSNLNTVCAANQCTGCMACIDSCAKRAIKIIDDITAYNAVIDSSLCVKCGRCSSACQVNNESYYREPIFWKQGWATDNLIRERASSGGAASAIALSFIREGGTVFSCTFEKGCFVFKEASTEDEVNQFCGSKYVKSDPTGVYKRISLRLAEGKRVLFIGLPCQVAAILRYTNHNDKLTTVDLICHGTPSPKVLEMALQSYGYELSTISEIRFRSKVLFGLQDGGLSIAPKGVRDLYTHLFLEGMTYSENCYSCKYARRQRISDITIGDSWGSEIEYSEQKKGISLILCQTEKGMQFLKNADLDLNDVDLDKAILNNRQLQAPMPKPDKRDKFLESLGKYSFSKSARLCFPARYYKNEIKPALLRLHIWPGGGK